MTFPEIPCLDTRRAAIQLDHDWPFFLELLRDFVAGYGDAAQWVRHELEAGEGAKAARQLHTLRGTAGNIGAMALMQSAEALETAIRAGQPAVGPLLDALDAQLAAVMAAVAPWLESAPADAADRPDTPPLDAAQLEALRVALARHDLEALDLFSALQPTLAMTLGEPAAQALAAAIQALRFDVALAQLSRHEGLAAGADRRTGV